MSVFIRELLLHGHVLGVAHDSCVRSEAANGYPHCKLQHRYVYTKMAC